MNETIYIVKVGETRTGGTRRYLVLQVDRYGVIQDITDSVCNLLNVPIDFQTLTLNVSGKYWNGDDHYLSAELRRNVIKLG